MDNVEVDKSNKYKLLFKFVPVYSILPICLYILVYCVTYFGAGFIIKHFNMKMHFPGIYIDNYIPYISLFVIPYCLFYLYIVLGPVLVARYNEYIFYRFILAGIIGSCIGFVTFLIKPTHVISNQIIAENFLDHILLFLRGCDYSARCCPSFHCFLAALVFIPIASCDNIKYEIKVKSFIISFLIILSTVLIKQHVIIDSISGVLLATISWSLAKNDKFIEILKNTFDKIKIFK